MQGPQISLWKGSNKSSFCSPTGSCTEASASGDLVRSVSGMNGFCGRHHVTNFVFKNGTRCVISQHFIFSTMHGYKFISLSDVKLICDPLKPAKWCIVCCQVVCDNFPIREKGSLSISFCVCPNSKCLMTLRGGRHDTR